MLRQPAVAGAFYPGDPATLRRMLDQMVPQVQSKTPAQAVIIPHAGYVYSGELAGQVLAQVEIPRKVVVLGPNHRGLGAPVAVMAQGAWQTPLGQVGLDAQFAADLMAAAPLVIDDALAHQYEHSLEVQVPLLQTLRADFLLTPLCLGRLDYAQCQELGQGLASAIAKAGEPVLLISSTDMTHYESAKAAEQKDRQAIERILALDPKGLYQTVLGQGISMCGVLPTTVVLIAALALGADQARLVGYTNSGVKTGDHRQVVGYAGLTLGKAATA